MMMQLKPEEEKLFEAELSEKRVQTGLLTQQDIVYCWAE